MSFILLFITFATASDVPENPPNACYDGCTDFMKILLNEFETFGVLPKKIPAVYSGVCHHLGFLDSEPEHYAVVLLDQRNQQQNFATIFAFFSQKNEFADWSVVEAQKEMSPYWNDNGKVITQNNTARVVIADELQNPSYVYWMRQNPITNDLLYITYAGISLKSFCRLQINANSSLSKP
jgi:hypothetical protein